MPDTPDARTAMVDRLAQVLERHAIYQTTQGGPDGQSWWHCLCGQWSGPFPGAHLREHIAPIVYNLRLPDAAGAPAGEPVQEYVAGLAFTKNVIGGTVVALIQKKRPDWQAGRYNGIGGHIEPGETPLRAMQREFEEEAGLWFREWEHFATLEGGLHLLPGSPPHDQAPA